MALKLPVTLLAATTRDHAGIFWPENLVRKYDGQFGFHGHAVMNDLRAAGRL